MTFDPTLSWPFILSAVTAAVLVLIWLIKLHSGHGTLTENVRELKNKVDTIDREYVKDSEISRVEERIKQLFVAMLDPIAKQVGEANHKLGNIDTKIDSRILTLLKAKGRDAD